MKKQNILDRIKPIIRALPGYRIVKIIYKFTISIVNPYHREVKYIQKHHPEEAFQIGPRTYFDRYPLLFSALRDQLEHHPKPHIVSFGCSTGEELLSLRSYLPNAQLIGIDINRASLKKAYKKTRKDHNIGLYKSSTITSTGIEAVDAIVCLSVLQHPALNHQHPEDCSPYITFEKYESTVNDFDNKLAVGGLLLLYHSNFNFLDTAVSKKYQPLLTMAPLSQELKVVYNPKNQRTMLSRNERFSLYRKTL